MSDRFRPRKPQQPLAERVSRALRRLALKVAYAGVRISWRIFHPITLGVRVILVHDEQVLLVKHTYRQGWFFPGGGIKRGETLEAAARREALEEAGATVRELGLLGLYSSFAESKSDHVAVYTSTAFEITAGHDDEIAAVQWFPVNALPSDLSPGSRRRLQEFLKSSRPPSG